jgi:hypothetical protein
VRHGKTPPEGFGKQASRGVHMPFWRLFLLGGDPMNTQDFKRKLTAVFSADVAGYSRLMGEDEAATVKTLELYKHLMFSIPSFLISYASLPAIDQTECT